MLPLFDTMRHLYLLGSGCQRDELVQLLLPGVRPHEILIRDDLRRAGIRLRAYGSNGRNKLDDSHELLVNETYLKSPPVTGTTFTWFE